MPTYALAIIPLMTTLSLPLQTDDKVKQSAYADDLTGAGSIDQLKRWWDMVVYFGRFLGYNAKASKSWLIVKPEYLDIVQIVFKDAGINITVLEKLKVDGILEQ